MILPEIHEFLGCRTPDAWVQAALADQETLLIDHKNCEFKAASTALSLMAKYNTHLDLINMMSRLAREELVHHEQVLRLMKRRGVPLRPVSAGRYASGLRRLVRATSRSSWWIHWWWGRSSRRAVANVLPRWCHIWLKSWAASTTGC